jgi:ankyrin repeat protein
VLLAAGTGVRAEPADIPALIDKLVEVTDASVASSWSIFGSGFAPLDTEGRSYEELRRSDALRQIVKHGAAAVPHLIAHLDDQRKTAIKVKRSDRGRLSLGEEFDVNRRTDRPPTAGKDRPAGKGSFTGKSYRVTVGDLSFVALGQIVNREYDAISTDQVSWDVLVNSPTVSPALRDRVKQAWGSLTPERHRACLVADFLKPDDDGRRIGACRRLAYYYPDTLEPLALKLLARAAYRPITVELFVRDELYHETDPERCRDLFKAYVARHGEASRDGILEQLFDDLESLEAYERGRLPRSLWEFGDKPRQLLVRLYGMSKDVTSQDRSAGASLSEIGRAKLIEWGLIYDRSDKIDRVVRDLLAASGDDDNLARACIKRLVGRGYDAEIEAYCRRRAGHLDREELQAIRDKLGWTPLHVAVDRNDLKTARLLLVAKARPDVPTRSGKTPLHLAAAAGNLEAAKMLVDGGAALDAKDKGGQTPVQLAVAMRSECLDVARFLADRGCSVPDVLVAVAVGRADLVERFLRDNPRAAGPETQSGHPLLHLAAVSGQAGVARVLLARGEKLDATTSGGETALHWAAWFGSEAVAGELIRAGANVRLTTGHGGWEPLHVAAWGGHAGVIRLLLKKGVAVDVTNAGSQTPLHLAAENGRVQAAEQLLAAKASVEAADWKGMTALHHAAGGGHLAVVKLLLAHKANVAAKDDQGRTPLDLARESGEEEIVKLLEPPAGKP